MPSANSRISTDAGVSQAESWAVIACCMAASMAAIIWSWRHDAMLNYGDAVAHLHIARRVFDSRTPRFSQLGSVWLPLPHILLIPFVQNYQWWATGLAGVIPSALAYIAACAGIYRLARHFVSRSASALALAFFALNPNLLYLQTTAMTEPLFLCEMIWIVVFLVEWRDALNAESESAGRSPHLGPSRSPGRLSPIAASFQNSLRAESSLPHHRGAWLGDPTAQRSASRSIFDTPSSRFMAAIAAVLVAAIFTRYDGWIIAFLVWCGIGIALWSHRRLDSPAFWLLTLPVVAAPIFWFVYNSVCFGDWLYFARGPYSAQAIELRTSTPGAWPPHPGWHNLWVSLLFYLKVSQLDSIAAAATGNKAANIVLALAALGFIAVCLAQRAPAARRIFSWVFLLWLPVPFYAWSVAYGSVTSSSITGGPTRSTTPAMASNFCPRSPSDSASLPTPFSGCFTHRIFPASSAASPPERLPASSPSRYSLRSPGSIASSSSATARSSTKKAPRISKRVFPTTKPSRPSFRICFRFSPTHPCS